MLFHKETDKGDEENNIISSHLIEYYKKSIEEVVKLKVIIFVFFGDQPSSLVKREAIDDLIMANKCQDHDKVL